MYNGPLTTRIRGDAVVTRGLQSGGAISAIALLTRGFVWQDIGIWAMYDPEVANTWTSYDTSVSTSWSNYDPVVTTIWSAYP